MRFGGLGVAGRICFGLGALFTPPYYGRQRLVKLNDLGYVSRRASISHLNLHLAGKIFLDDRVLIFQHKEGGPVRIADHVFIHRDCIVQTGQGGSVSIGSNTYIQPRCQFSAYIGAIKIGSHVQIAPNCAFYSYDHSFKADQLIIEQPLQSKGGIVVEDDAWLGVGAIVLDGVRIGKGTVIGAGSVVTRDIPDGAIAVGVPARVVKMRSELHE